MNVISTQLRDPRNSGLTRGRMAVKKIKWTPPRNFGKNPVSKHQIQPECGDEQAEDGTVEPVSRDQILRRERGQGNIRFPCSADHEQDWQPCPVDLYFQHARQVQRSGGEGM